VARPKVPLISRRRALEVALEIADNEGLAALSIRRLGEALNVNGASLYYHFTNKEDILVGTTQLALANVTSPRSDQDGWRSWLPRNTFRTRQALVAHPGLIPVMLRRASLGIGAKEVEASIERLEAEGVPIEAVVPLMESLELLAIVSALQEVGQHGGWSREGAELTALAAIRRAERAWGLTSRDLFESLCTSVMASVETAVQLKQVRKARANRPALSEGPSLLDGRAPCQPASLRSNLIQQHSHSSAREPPGSPFRSPDVQSPAVTAFRDIPISVRLWAEYGGGTKGQASRD
jgi:TetR/AcrR family tetracycline transcriptional repressor